MKSCPYCHAAVPDAAETCPSCGERQPVSPSRGTRGPARCPRCGEGIPSDSPFCPHCGCAVSAPDAVPEPQQTAPSGRRGARAGRSTQSSSGRKWLLLVLLAAVLAVCLCAALVLLGSTDSGDSSQAQSGESADGAPSQDGTETSGDPGAQTVYETGKLLTRVTCTSEDGEEADAYRYFYDENGQMTKYYDLGVMRYTYDCTVYDYDGNGRIADVRYYREDPDWEETEDGDGSGRYSLSQCCVYAYDEEGRVTAATTQDAEGTVLQVTEYTYGTDPETSPFALSTVTTVNGEVTRRETGTPVYDEATDTICVDSESVNYLNGGVMYSYNSRNVYDSSLRLISCSNWTTDSNTGHYNCEYDDAGNLTGLSYTSLDGDTKTLSVYTYERDSDGTILSMTWDCLDHSWTATQTPGIGELTIGASYQIRSGDTLRFTYYYEEEQVPAA